MTSSPATGGTTGDWSGAVVVVAGVSWEGNRLGAQHIAQRLTRYAPVLYVDPPRTPRTVARNPWLQQSDREPRLRLVHERLARLTPVVPPLKTRPGGRRLAGAVLRRQISAAVGALGADVHALLTIPPHHRVFGAAGERLTVHLASDDFAAGARLNRVSERWVRASERRIADQVDVVVAVSPLLRDKWRALGHDAVLITNGCDVELFASVGATRPAADVRLPGPVAGFVGTLSERTDVRLLEAVADRGHSLLLVGPRSRTAPHRRLDALLGRPEVQWVDRRPHAALPAYLAAIDVGLVPYVDDAFNRASFPLKVLEYLAAGRPVVSTDLPAVRWLATELVTTADGAERFGAAVSRLLADPGGPGPAADRRAFAARHGWDRRVAELADVLGLASSSRPDTTSTEDPP